MQNHINILNSAFRRSCGLVRNGRRTFTAKPPPASLVETEFKKWIYDHDSVHQSWHACFSSDPYYQEGGAFAKLLGVSSAKQKPKAKPPPTVPRNPRLCTDIDLNVRLTSIIRSYQQRGHLVADLDPLGIIKQPSRTDLGVEMRVTDAVTRYPLKITINDMDKEMKLPPSTLIGGDEPSLPLKDIIDRLEKTYCRKIGLEYTFMTRTDEVNYIKSKFEPPGATALTTEKKISTLNRLVKATVFEQFLQKKYPSEKRFGLEGCEMLIPAMKSLIDVTSMSGVDTFVIGMAHRGRLNVLANVCRKPLHNLFTQFAGLEASDETGSGDVKYHLGMYIERTNRKTNKNIRISLIANPSHLEAVNPVVEGRAKALQFFRGDRGGEKVMPILVHGDASNAGQGVVYEVLHLSGLPDYTTGGTIHIVANNQIGFTTDPRYSRSSRYCTDVQKVVDGPIIHVNADCPESVIHCCHVAAEYRTKFHRDIVIDLIGYRRHGHNEIDEPMFTQPLMYKVIKQKKTCMELYAEELIKQGTVTKEIYEKMKADYEATCNEDFQKASLETQVKFAEWVDSPWSGFFEGRSQNCKLPTGIPAETLTHIGTRFSSPPPNAADFVMHKGIERILQARLKMVESREADWSLGEALAFGSLLKEGTHVRLSGQDVERGTFSHRHHVLHHQEVDKAQYNTLNHLYPDQSEYTVVNSSLSEAAVLGFEHGYSMTNPNTLVMWEGQFGDFCNNCQVIIDQFIASGEAKWIRQSGIVMLLPHAMEGMGPEHSSCRLERFLQLCDDDADCVTPCDGLKQLHDTNIIVANCSTPANLFHILRRQIYLPFRKPLILATPKSLLRLPACRSSFDDMLEGTEFRHVIPDPECYTNPKTIIFCTGKTYYDLVEARNVRGKSKEVVIHRIEQICPFPYSCVIALLEKYPSAEVVWAQEEHKNQGCWPYVQPRLCTAQPGRCIFYVGRPPSASPATGSKHRNYKEIETYLSTLFGPAPQPKKEEPPKASTAGGAAPKPDGSNTKKPKIFKTKKK